MILAILLMLQPVQPPVANDPKPAEWPDPEREVAGGGALAKTGNDTAARLTMARYADCVVDSSPDKVADVLMRDLRTPEYRNGLRNLSRANEGCARKVGLRGSLRMAELPFAAALAEEALRRGTSPLKMRLAKAAGAAHVQTFASTDALAMCIVRSTPDDVAALLTSAPGSDAEAAALATTGQAAQLCARGSRLEITPIGLRSIVATAAYRLLASEQAAQSHMNSEQAE